MSNLETNKTIALRLIEIFNGREPRRFRGLAGLPRHVQGADQCRGERPGGINSDGEIAYSRSVQHVSGTTRAGERRAAQRTGAGPQHSE
jgi:hypothetical protein